MPQAICRSKFISYGYAFYAYITCCVHGSFPFFNTNLSISYPLVFPPGLLFCFCFFIYIYHPPCFSISSIHRGFEKSGQLWRKKEKEDKSGGKILYPRFNSSCRFNPLCRFEQEIWNARARCLLHVLSLFILKFGTLFKDSIRMRLCLLLQ